ncbi:NLR family CARD domain-containing protein 3 [Pleuronectes platessa]|uniref:NLR family CARD domain-containing protein 3 n=1 Tax=Pleuronectes platessa TaxID=8262 RepID=UPI00232A25F0|nr:NLR family CARD domain-containing protein 3 [Pleuronectes platessa]
MRRIKRKLIDSAADPSPELSISSHMTTDGSEGPGGVSWRSDASMHIPPNIGDGSPEGWRPKTELKGDSEFNLSSCSSQTTTDGSQGPGGVSWKSDASMHIPPNIGDGRPKRSHTTDGSLGPGGVSWKSDASMHIPPNIGAESPESQMSEEPSGLSCKQCLRSDWDESDSPCSTCGTKRQKLSQSHRVGTGVQDLFKLKDNFKEEMRKKFTFTSEGTGDDRVSLDNIYTEVFITAGESGGQEAEHEFSQLERKLKMPSLSKYTVNLKDIFRPSSGQEKIQRLVLTKGMAGIGKSFSVHKFIYDWAKGDTNTDFDFVFYFAFRELNLSSGDKSLHKLLTDFHPVLGNLESPELYAKTKVVVILDGLDESRLKLDFENTGRQTSLSEETSLGTLLVNLIQGNLLPDAKVWITSRPSASSQIPSEYVDMVTEIRGFNDAQKTEYFRRRFSHDLGLAERIDSHIHSSQHLQIMCQTPIFCWISAILFQEVFAEDKNAEIPQTLTEMMAHYLLALTKRRNRKYDKKPQENFLITHREFLLKLGKLAFDHLQKNSLIFYEEELEAYGIDIKEASIHSGFCTSVLREEDVFSHRKVFFFVHLTIQEFFAALYVYDCFTNKKTTELNDFLKLKDKEPTLLELLKVTVERVLKKKNCHLVYFLRFLLGLLVEANMRVLQGLLTLPDPSQDIDKKILTYLKSIRRKTLSPGDNIVLFRVMIEIRDQKVKEEIEEYLKTEYGSTPELSPLHCSALAYMLQISENDLDLLDLKSYNTSDEGRKRLIPAVRSSRKAILASCNVTTERVEHVAFGLTFPWSPLRDLDLSNNDLKDSGVKLLCDGLKSQHCKLKKLRLSGCLVTKTGCECLASALQSNPSHLKELNLSYNDPGESGINLLSTMKEDSKYKLDILKFDHCGSHRMKPGFKKYACELTLDPNTAHKNLRLSEENRKVTWGEEQQSYHPHPERFDQCPQVLCEQSLDGCCYWEVEVTEPFNIGVTYKPPLRSGDVDDCKLGCNDKSWSLVCSDEGCYTLHRSQRVGVSSLCQRSSRVGVYLDWPGGSLSFYRVLSNNWVHLHTFRTKFSEPLYPAVELHTHSSALFC